MIGKILGNRYKIIAELGSGGMAWVYLAEDLRENRRVAVKVLYPQHSQDLGFLQRFSREARLAMRLSQSAPQSHIVPVLDYGSDQDIHYLVMEFVQGRDLGQVLDERGPLPWPEALGIARQVAQALGDAHRLDIVHRDIKPGNIMLTPQGNARVLDFGIARARSSPEITVSGFVGSPNYAAPEQVMGEPVDTRADLYSLGIVLYRMLSGRLPFEGDTAWAVVNQHVSSPPPPLKTARPDLPDSVIHLVDRLLAKRAGDRFQTPEHLIQAIDVVLAGHDLPQEPAPAAQEAPDAQLERLYHQARQAVEAKAWQEAVDLFSQVARIAPDYRDVAQQLSAVGEQIRLATLYRSARRALEIGHWDHALEQLDRIAELSPGYQDIDTLKTQAEKREPLTVGDEGKAAEFPTQVEPESPDLVQIRAKSAEPARPTTTDHARPRGRRVLLLLLPMLVAVAALAFLLQPRRTQPPIVEASNTPTATETLVATATRRPSPTAQPSATPTDMPRSPTPRPTSSPAPASPSATLTLSPTLTPALQVTPTLAPTTVPRLEGQIAFPRFDPVRGTYDVYACQVDGAGCQRLVAEASQPDFLPDGRQLVVHSWRPDDKGLVLHKLPGSDIWKITGQIEAARPSVDFQGQTYVYHSRQEADRQPRLYRTHGAEARPIVREASTVLGVSPAWLPDGRILYSGCLQDRCGIIVMRADGSSPQQIVAGSDETNPEASPDGRRITFMSRRDGNWEVYVVNLDGSGLRRLTHNTSNDGLPTWSPDGQAIAFVSDRDGDWAVWVMRADGSNPRRLFAIGGPLDGQVEGAAPHEVHGWVEERISWSPVP